MSKNTENRDFQDLNAAIAAWKTSARRSETLSDVVRSRIVARAGDRKPRPAIRTLFLPFRRLALAGALPVVLLTALVGYATHQSLAPAPGLVPPPILASKAAGEVIFTIANGNRVHNVYLSTSPDRFENSPAFTTRDGAFRDRLDGGPDLVFYRID